MTAAHGQTFARYTRPVTITAASGSPSGQVEAFLRGLRTEELVGSVDQDELIMVTTVSALDRVGLWPLPKYARVSDGTRTYTVQFDRDAYAGARPVFVKARLKG